MTSYNSIKPTASGEWEDSAVVADKGVIPGDLDAFTAKIIEEVKERSTKAGQRRAALASRPGDRRMQRPRRSWRLNPFEEPTIIPRCSYRRRSWEQIASEVKSINSIASTIGTLCLFWYSRSPGSARSE
jgi:hypothetical protein